MNATRGKVLGILNIDRVRHSVFKPGNKIQNGDHGRRFTFGERFAGQVTAVYQKFQRFVNNYCSFMLN